MRDHLLLFDDHCPLCRRAVARAIAIDPKKLFMFASLESRTAKQALKGKMAYIRKQNTLVLIENVSRQPCMLWTRGRAIMRLFWLAGGHWKWIGWLCYVPLLTDLVYKLVAKIRQKFKVEDVPDRFFRSHKDLFLQ